MAWNGRTGTPASGHRFSRERTERSDAVCFFAGASCFPAVCKAVIKKQTRNPTVFPHDGYHAHDLRLFAYDFNWKHSFPHMEHTAPESPYRRDIIRNLTELLLIRTPPRCDCRASGLPELSRRLFSQDGVLPVFPASAPKEIHKIE